MTNFSVALNGVPLAYQTAFVSDTSDYLNGGVKTVSVEEAIKDQSDFDYLDY